MSPRRAAHAAILFAALVRVAYVAADLARSPLAAVPIHDAARYDAWSRAILAGRAFESGAFSQAPLYPYALAGLYALAGPRAWAVFAIQAALGVATVALTVSIARRARGEGAAACAAWLVALAQPLAFFETKLLPAALVVALATLFVAWAQRADDAPRAAAWAGPGALLGVIVVGSASFLLAVPAIAAWVACDRHRAAGARAARVAVLVAAAAIVLGPVAARNRLASGSWVLVATNGGITFWQGNNPIAQGTFSTPEGFTGAIESQREEARRLAASESGRPLDDAAASAFWFAKGRAYLLADPGRTAALLGRKLLLAVSSAEQPLEYSPRLDSNPFRWLMAAPFGVLLALAAASLAASRPRRAEGPAWIVVGVCGATALGFFVASRYRLPAVPALAAIAGGGAVVLSERVMAGGRALVAPALSAMVLLAVSLAWFPVTQQRLSLLQDAMSFDDLGNATRDGGRPEQALALYDRSAALDPVAPFSRIDRAKALAALGRGEEAERCLRDAVSLAPDLAEAHFELGVRLFESGRLEEAAASFGRALELDPGSANAGNNYAGTLLRLGRKNEAREVLRTMRARGLAVDAPLLRAAGGA